MSTKTAPVIDKARSLAKAIGEAPTRKEIVKELRASAEAWAEIDADTIRNILCLAYAADMIEKGEVVA